MWNFDEYLFSSGDGERWAIIERQLLHNTISRLSTYLQYVARQNINTIQKILNKTEHINNVNTGFKTNEFLRQKRRGRTSSMLSKTLHAHAEVLCKKSNMVATTHIMVVEMQIRLDFEPIQLMHSSKDDSQPEKIFVKIRNTTRLLIRDVDPSRSGGVLSPISLTIPEESFDISHHNYDLFNDIDFTMNAEWTLVDPLKSHIDDQIDREITNKNYVLAQGDVFYYLRNVLDKFHWIGNNIRKDEEEDEHFVLSSHSISWIGEDNTIACNSFLYADSSAIADDGIDGCISSIHKRNGQGGVFINVFYDSKVHFAGKYHYFCCL